MRFKEYFDFLKLDIDLIKQKHLTIIKARCF